MAKRTVLRLRKWSILHHPILPKN